MHLQALKYYCVYIMQAEDLVAGVDKLLNTSSAMPVLLLEKQGSWLRHITASRYSCSKSEQCYR
jgi:hypothetical protein